ncbi:peptidylprolyl isomerase, partial [Verrucomicrobiota bacterium]
LLAILVLNGCGGDGKDQAPTGRMGMEAPLPTATAPMAAIQPGNPDEVLVEVDGTKLTRGQAEQEVRLRTAAMAGKVDPERLATVQKQMMSSAAEQFIMRTLLLNEAKRLGVDVTQEDEDQAFAQIREKLPPGTTLEQVMQKSPLGEERMREEVLAGITINKLLSTHMTGAVEIADEEIDAFLEDNRDKLAVPESVHARHILVTLAPEDSEEVKAQKREKIDGIHKQLVDGADFAELAKEASHCPSAERGGDLGVFGRGQMVKAFEDVAFGQATNAIGQVVETEYGFHVIEVLAHHEGRPVEREQVERMLSTRKQQESTMEYINALKAKADIKYGESVKFTAPAGGPAPMGMPVPPPPTP